MTDAQMMYKQAINADISIHFMFTGVIRSLLKKASHKTYVRCFLCIILAKVLKVDKKKLDRLNKL